MIATLTGLLDLFGVAVFAVTGALTASLPTAVVAGVVHAVVTILVVKPAGKGEYA